MAKSFEEIEETLNNLRKRSLGFTEDSFSEVDNSLVVWDELLESFRQIHNECGFQKMLIEGRDRIIDGLNERIEMQEERICRIAMNLEVKNG